MKLIELTSHNWETQIYINVDHIINVTKLLFPDNAGNLTIEKGTVIQIKASNIYDEIVMDGRFWEPKTIKLKPINTGVSVYVNEPIYEVIGLLEDAGVEVFSNKGA